MTAGHLPWHDGRMQHAAAWRAVAVAAVAAAVACAALGLWLDLTAAPAPGGGSAASGSIPGLALTIPGALLLWRLGPHPLAVVLTLFGVLWGIDGPAVGAVNLAVATGIDSPAASWGFWYYVRFGAILLLPIQLVLLLFPDGRLATGAWRAVSVASLALAAVMPLVYLLAPAEVLAAGDADREAELARFDPGAPSLPLPDAVWDALLVAAFPSAALSTALALAVTIGRRRGATPERRAQLRWLIWAGLVFVALLLLSQVLPSTLGDVLFALGIGFLSVSILIAVTRHGLYAIDRLLSWTILYSLLLGGVVLVDVGIYLLVGTLFDDRVTMLVALLVVIAAYTPVRDRLFRLVSRWVNGARDDPYEVLSSLADRLEAADDPLGELARSIARAFASGFVRVELDRQDGTMLAAESGSPGQATVEIPLVHDGRPIGRIRMLPGRRAAVSRRDRRLLGDLVRLSAAAILNAELSRELQAIREGLVAAREEERARLRRELHDGLGPLLGGIRLRLEAARNLAERDPARSLATLDTAIDESREVVDEIRRLVHDLRPPALDDLGLVRALAQQAERLSGPDLSITVASAELPPLSAAVEVAVYRIVSEALTNVVKHAGARSAAVALTAHPGSLIVDVRDDGRGMPADAPAGVGLVSLRSRAVELGGTLEILPADPGTHVRATLPLRTEAQDAR